MTEYINKAELIEQYPEFDGYTFADVTTIDIVRCGECRYENGNELYVMCSKTGCEVNLTHFCADGERKE